MNKESYNHKMKIQCLSGKLSFPSSVAPKLHCIGLTLNGCLNCKTQPFFLFILNQTDRELIQISVTFQQISSEWLIFFYQLFINRMIVH